MSHIGTNVRLSIETELISVSTYDKKVRKKIMDKMRGCCVYDDSLQSFNAAAGQNHLFESYHNNW